MTDNELERCLPPGPALAKVFGDQLTAQHIGPRLTCGETNLVARALADLSQYEAAVTLLVAHAVKDEVGDLHELLMPGEDATDAVLRQAAGEHLDQL